MFRVRAAFDTSPVEEVHGPHVWMCRSVRGTHMCIPSSDRPCILESSISASPPQWRTGYIGRSKISTVWTCLSIALHARRLSI